MFWIQINNMEQIFFDCRRGRISLEVPETIYSPQEDSFLLAKSMENMAPRLMDSRFLEIGCGSGLLSILAAKLGAVVTAVDLNPDAIEATEKNARTNSVHINAIYSDLFSSVSGIYDFIVFNAPYLPDNDVHVVEKSRMQWSMHSNKGNVIERFISGCSRHMNENTKVLLLYSSLSGDVPEILKRNGFSFEIIGKKKLDFEEIFVAAIEKSE